MDGKETQVVQTGTTFSRFAQSLKEGDRVSELELDSFGKTIDDLRVSIPTLSKIYPKHEETLVKEGRIYILCKNNSL